MCKLWILWIATSLAACGGETQPVQSVPLGNPAIPTVVSLKGERFKATSVELSGYCGSRGYPFDIFFNAHGKATGPYPGAFVASGQWDVYISSPFGKHGYGFDEKLAVRSGGETIKGTISWYGDAGAQCNSFGPNRGRWRTKGQNPKRAGPVTIAIIESGHLEETFK